MPWMKQQWDWFKSLCGALKGSPLHPHLSVCFSQRHVYKNSLFGTSRLSLGLFQLHASRHPVPNRCKDHRSGRLGNLQEDGSLYGDGAEWVSFVFFIKLWLLLESSSLHQRDAEVRLRIYKKVKRKQTVLLQATRPPPSFKCISSLNCHSGTLQAQGRWWRTLIIPYLIPNFMFCPKSSYPCHHLSAAPLLPRCKEKSLHLHTGNGSGPGDSPHDFLQVRFNLTLNPSYCQPNRDSHFS